MENQRELILKGLSENQRKAAEAKGCDVIVRAGAGSGKTKTLVARYLLLLHENRDWSPEDITAVTFTQKAAREMQSRIREQMLMLSYYGEKDDKQFWLKKLTEMDRACIGTIHSLYSRILRAHPAETGLDPKFTVLGGNESSILIENVLTDFISQISKEHVYDNLLHFYSESMLRDVLKAMLGSRSKVDAALTIAPKSVTSFLSERVKFYLYDSEIPEIIEEYESMILSPDYEKTAGKIADNIRNLVRAFADSREAFRKEKHPLDCLEILYSPFRNWSFSMGPTKVRAKAKFVRDLLDKENPCLGDKDHSADWYKDNWEKYEKADILLRKLWPELKKAYWRDLDSTDAVDFDELETRALRLLHEDPSICNLWQSRIKSLLVDEYQDTNEDQAELFSLLDPAHDRLFAVGDKKQSIYGFRGTNVSLFDKRGQSVAESGGEDINLDITYRTDPALLAPMGEMLDSVMTDDALKNLEHYAAYEAMKAGKKASGKEGPFIEILLGKGADRRNDSDFSIAAQALANRLFELKQSGQIENWNEAAVLCRRSNDFKFYENAFADWKIPYVTVAGQGFYDRPEIREVKNMLIAAENPFDDAAFSGFLLSPSIGFTSDMLVSLYKFAKEDGPERTFHHAMMDDNFHFEEENHQEILQNARTVFQTLNRLAGRVPVDEVLGELYHLTGIRTMLAMDHKERAWMNLDKLLSDARHAGIASVTEFLEYLDIINESGAREGEAPSDNEGAVRIMTIHKAKGLEFPLTIIGSANVGITSKQAALYIGPAEGIVFTSSPVTPNYIYQKLRYAEAEKSEWLRLFYVAATRAENRLIISGNLPGASSDSWLKRVVDNLPKECMKTQEYMGPAFGAEGDVLFIQSNEEPLDPPDNDDNPEKTIEKVIPDLSLLLPITSKQFTVKKEDNSFALIVGKMVHKGLELWCFPGDADSDMRLEEAFNTILMQSERLNSEERKKAVKKAVKLLERFRSCEVYDRICKAEKCWHELPFSIPGKNHTINGVIDVLLKTGNVYTVIDFKTDELRSPDELNQAMKKHAIQLAGYRKAVKMTVETVPNTEICFLDYRGQVRSVLLGEKYPNNPVDNWNEGFLEDSYEEPEMEAYWDDIPITDPVDRDSIL